MTDETPAPDEFKLSEEEAFTLALAKHWLMLQDVDGERNAKRRDRKGDFIAAYRRQFRELLAAIHRPAADVPEPYAEAIGARLQHSDWLPAFSSLLSNCWYQEYVLLLATWEVIAATLGTVSKRDRAVLLTIELLCFEPWSGEVNLLKRTRLEQVIAIAAAFGAPIDADDVRDLDRDITRRLHKLGVGVSWKRLGLIGVAGTGLVVVTGGSAAGVLGPAMASVGGVGLVAQLAARPLDRQLNKTSTRSLPRELVKLQVQTNYWMLREKSDVAKARLVAQAMEQALREQEARTEELEAVLASVVEKLALTRSALGEVDRLTAERDELKKQLEVSQEIQRLYELTGADLRESIVQFRPALSA